MKIGHARIVLTGAGGGIGTAAARDLARGGAALLLVGRSAERLAAQAQALKAASGAAVAWQVTDLTDTAALQSLAQAAADWKANVLVHGAGTPAFGRVESFGPAQVQQAIATNLVAPVLLTQALLPHLRQQARAQVVCIGSVLGRLGLPGFSIYSAGKFGLRGFAEALRRELAPTPVRVQYLGPRSTRTAFNDDRVEAYNRRTGTAVDPPERVAQALCDLIENEAAEAFLGFPEALAVRANGAWPGLLDGAFAKHRASLPPSSADSPTPSPALHGATSP